MKDIKVVFMGTPSFAVPILKGLIDNYHVVLVVSQPDKEKDKKGNIIKTPIKELALNNNIPVFQPHNIKEDYKTILEYNPDIIITCAYGQIVPDIILNYPQYGCINVHGSLLPKLRGGAPIHHAIINGDKETGITIMYMDSKMDAGDIITQRIVSIEDDDYLDTVYDKLSLVGRDLLLETLPSIINGTSTRIKQDESLVTYGMNIKKSEEKINFNDSAKNIRNHVRGLNSIPGAYCFFENKRLKIYDCKVLDKDSKKEPGTIEEITKNSIVISTKDKLLALKNIKLEGKKRCTVSEYLNGIQDKNKLIGKVLK